jgi:hypothetical protein
MVIYYLYCHPSRNIKWLRTADDLEVNRRRHSYVSRDQQRRVFDERDWATEEQIELIKKHLTDHLSQREALNIDTVDIKRIGQVKKVFRRRRIVN